MKNVSLLLLLLLVLTSSVWAQSPSKDKLEIADIRLYNGTTLVPTTTRTPIKTIDPTSNTITFCDPTASFNKLVFTLSSASTTFLGAGNVAVQARNLPLETINLDMSVVGTETKKVCTASRATPPSP